MLLHQTANSQGNYNFNAYQYFNTGWSPHFHQNFELIYVQSGEISLTVSGKISTVRSGQYALILSNQIHAITPVGAVSYWIAVFSEQYVPLFARSVEGRCGVSSVFEGSEEVDLLLWHGLIGHDGSLMMKKACFYAVCDCFLRQIPLTERRTQSDERIGRILDFVAEHYRENITLSAVAAEFGYEYHYLSRLLHREYQIDFSRLVNEYRLNCALHLLEEGKLSMTEIASESGFQSLRNFNHIFLLATGHSPRSHFAQTAETFPAPSEENAQNG